MVSTARQAEIKTRTTSQVKKEATDIYSRWGLSLSDAINIFLIKSIEVGGLPFNMRTETIPYDELASRAYKAELDENGIATLPDDWDDDDE